MCNTIYFTVYCKVYTLAHSMHRSPKVGTCPKPFEGVGHYKATLRVPEYAFTININSINKNTSIKTDLS